MSENTFAMQPDLPEHIATWYAYNERSTWMEVIAKGGSEEIARTALVSVPDVSALEALAANRAAVELLSGRRWYVIRNAREAGASWDAIGEALGVTSEVARDEYYLRPIEKQETYVADLHDAARARAVLSDDAQ